MSSLADGAIVHWLGRTQEDPQPEVLGGKALNLDRLERLGCRVPRGFCLTTAAFERYLAANGLAEERRRLEQRLPDPAARERLQALVLEHPLPRAQREALVDALGSLDAREPGEELAVRSSGVAEDASDASYAGQHDSILGIAPGEAEDAIRRCWASLWSERAVAYRDAHELGQDAGAMGVIVQRLVPAEASAVLFTVDPVTGSPDRLVLNATPGLGEELLSGEASGATYLVDRTAASVESDDPGCLSEEHALDLAQRSLELERAYGAPLDVEAALAGDRWHFLQARPVTARGEQALADGRGG